MQKNLEKFRDISSQNFEIKKMTHIISIEQIVSEKGIFVGSFGSAASKPPKYFSIVSCAYLGFTCPMITKVVKSSFSGY